MFGKPEIMDMAAAMSVYAGIRQSAIAQNVANADTPGYRARDLRPFNEVYRSPDSSMRATRPGHLASGTRRDDYVVADRPGPGNLSPNGNDVSIEAEMVRAAETSGQSNRALAIYRSSLDLLRTSLGRR